MKIYVFGGAAAQQEMGWADSLRQIFPNLLVNAAMPGGGSGLALYHALTQSDLCAGDVIVWECCMDDQHAIDHGAASVQDMLCNVEALLRHCAEQDIVFAPLILHSRNGYAAPEAGPYRSALLQLFDHYGLPCIDLKAELHKALNPAPTPDELYAASDLLQIDTALPEFIAELVADLVDQAMIPNDAVPKHLPAQTRFAGICAAQGNAVTLLASDLTLTGYRPAPSLTLTAPETGILQGVAVLASDTGGALKLKVRFRKSRISLTAPDLAQPGALRLIDLSKVLVKPIQVTKGEKITLTWQDTPGWARAGSGFSDRMTPKDLEKPTGAILGAYIRHTHQE